MLCKFGMTIYLLTNHAETLWMSLDHVWSSSWITSTADLRTGYGSDLFTNRCIFSVPTQWQLSFIVKHPKWLYSIRLIFSRIMYTRKRKKDTRAKSPKRASTKATSPKSSDQKKPTQKDVNKKSVISGKPPSPRRKKVTRDICPIKCMKQSLLSSFISFTPQIFISLSCPRVLKAFSSRGRQEITMKLPPATITQRFSLSRLITTEHYQSIILCLRRIIFGNVVGREFSHEINRDVVSFQKSRHK